MTGPFLILLLAAFVIVIAGRSWLQRGGQPVSAQVRTITVLALVLVGAALAYYILAHGRTAP